MQDEDTTKPTSCQPDTAETRSPAPREQGASTLPQPDIQDRLEQAARILIKGAQREAAEAFSTSRSRPTRTEEAPE